MVLNNSYWSGAKQPQFTGLSTSSYYTSRSSWPPKFALMSDIMLTITVPNEIQVLGTSINNINRFSKDKQCLVKMFALLPDFSLIFQSYCSLLPATTCYKDFYNWSCKIMVSMFWRKLSLGTPDMHFYFLPAWIWMSHLSKKKNKVIFMLVI